MAPSIPLHKLPRPSNPIPSPLPTLLQSPTGLALLELQGTINLPDDTPSQTLIPIGKIDFPDYSPDSPATDTAWMKRVYLYVGQHQRLTGEVKKLPKPLGVIRRRGGGDGDEDGETEELEIVEIVRYKLVFSNRPEPVGGQEGV